VITFFRPSRSKLWARWTRQLANSLQSWKKDFLNVWRWQGRSFSVPESVGAGATLQRCLVTTPCQPDSTNWWSVPNFVLSLFLKFLGNTRRIRSRSVGRGNGCRVCSALYPRITEECFQREHMGCLVLDNYEKKRPEGPQRGTVFMLKLAWPKGEAHRAEPKFWVGFLWGNGNELRGLRAKFWRGPSYHAKGCFQGYQHVMLSSIVRVWAFPWHKTIFPPSRGSIPCIIAEKALKMPHFSKTGSRNMAETCSIDFSYPTSYSTSIQLGGVSTLLLPVLMGAGHRLGKFRAKRRSAGCLALDKG